MTYLITGAMLLSVLLGPAGADTPADTVSVEPAGESPAAARLEGERGDYLIGPLTRARWEAFEPELAFETRSYEVSTDMVDALADGGGEIDIICVLGTWCSDSRREVPRLWKILDLMGADAFEMEMIAVGRSDAPEALDWEAENGVVPGYRSRYDIEYVPTFIIMDAGLEIGRIIETPETSLEADLAMILGVTPAPRTH